ncbi:EamA family transporter [Rhodococcus sp. H29-C3]|uniref:EamA family transporter n=1 Tax=Rhodococcus sp. H29-C3 TaxID=3046307 RepID=UPI0024BA3876|nr:EamA family transporter [Rhodococcus sp. H29-C3]MDJ0362257.1 EamA family transporter [Rhodococcus sp. H29-C3]
MQFGQAMGKSLFDIVSPAGVVTLRLVISALLVGVVVRPALPRTRRELGLTVTFGTVIAGMNIVYLALEHLPVGVAATIQLLGPLTIAIAMTRNPLDIVWSALALVGLVLFAVPTAHGGDSLSVPGMLLAGLSAVSMGAYVLVSKRAGAAAADARYLSWALVWASILWAPFGVATDGSKLLDPGILAIGFLVAILSAAVPYSLELVALRKLSPRVVGTLQSLEPAVGAVAGLVVLGEILTMSQIAAVTCVSVASVAAVSCSRRRDESTPQAPRRRRIRLFRRSSGPRAPNATAAASSASDPSTHVLYDERQHRA